MIVAYIWNLRYSHGGLSAVPGGSGFRQPPSQNWAGVVWELILYRLVIVPIRSSAMLDEMNPHACNNQEQICRCDLCTHRVRTVVIESPDASRSDAGARAIGIGWASVGLPNRRPERLVPRFHRSFTEA